ncbi:MAG: efflux RND transporter periplasmic adaptor subunit [Verrucomicrobiota bacterium]
MKKACLVLLCFGAIILPRDSNGQEAPPPVEVVRAIRSADTNRVISFTGTVQSRRQAKLSARTEGLVSVVSVDAGSEVEKGDVLMSLDTELAEIDLKLVAAEILTAEEELADAERRVTEVSDLIASGAFPKSELEARKAAVRIRAAQLETLRVRRDQEKERIERNRVIAPFSGFISQKATEAGEWVDTGTMVLELVETDSLWFDLQVAQEYLGAIREAKSASIQLDAFPDRPLPAVVDVLVPVKDPVSRTFLTRLAFTDPERLASPGMSGTASLSYSSGGEPRVTIPRDAVVRFPDGSAKVWIVETKDGDSGENRRETVFSVAVKTSDTLGETVEILGGLKGGERVVVRGNEGLAEGQEVAPRERTLADPELRL